MCFIYEIEGHYKTNSWLIFGGSSTTKIFSNLWCSEIIVIFWYFPSNSLWECPVTPSLVPRFMSPLSFACQIRYYVGIIYLSPPLKINEHQLDWTPTHRAAQLQKSALFPTELVSYEMKRHDRKRKLNTMVVPNTPTFWREGWYGIHFLNLWY